MTEDEARRIELVRAVELEDREAVLLTREDREQADAHARGRPDGPLLAARADFAATRLLTRHPGLARLLEKSRWPGWVGIGVPAGALALGFLANEFGTDKRMDLLAVPLLGTIAWNLLVYLWIATAFVLRRGARDPLAGALARLGEARGADGGAAIDRAAAAFRARWAAITAPLNAARTARTLHLAAALFAAGLIGGIYARALVIEYRAGWESTFLGPEAVRAILTTVLGPASGASGVAIPPLAEIAAMRWSGVETGGVNAGPWIHLYTLTIAGIVIVPRLLLALWQGARTFRLARNLPVAGRHDFYVRRVLRAGGSAPARARITPYAYRPGEETRRRAAAALRAALGDSAEVRFDEPVDYGTEEAWLADHPFDPQSDYHLLLYTLSATPEAENHGELAQRLALQAKAAGSGAIVGALVDESPFRAHFAGQAGLDERIAGRLAAWRSALAGAGIVPLGVDLSAAQDDALARRIEAHLLPDAELRR